MPQPSALDTVQDADDAGAPLRRALRDAERAVGARTGEPTSFVSMDPTPAHAFPFELMQNSTRRDVAANELACGRERTVGDNGIPTTSAETQCVRSGESVSDEHVGLA